MHLSRAALDAIMAQAEAASGEECCGLLLAEAASPGDSIDAILPAENVAANRHDRFEIAPSVLIRAHKAQRGGGRRIVGYYHSHPGGDPTPSAEDAAQADANGAFWLICAGPPWTATLWRAVAVGQVHGRFDPVPFDIESGHKPCIDGDRAALAVEPTAAGEDGNG